MSLLCPLLYLFSDLCDLYLGRLPIFVLFPIVLVHLPFVESFVHLPAAEDCLFFRVAIFASDPIL